jgi:hypothetical protein
MNSMRWAARVGAERGQRLGQNRRELHVSLSSHAFSLSRPLVSLGARRRARCARMESSSRGGRSPTRRSRAAAWGPSSLDRQAHSGLAMTSVVRLRRCSRAVALIFRSPCRPRSRTPGTWEPTSHRRTAGFVLRKRRLRLSWDRSSSRNWRGPPTRANPPSVPSATPAG